MLRYAAEEGERHAGGEGLSQSAGPSANYKMTEVCKMASSSYYSWAATANKWGWASSGWHARALEKGSCSRAWHQACITHNRWERARNKMGDESCRSPAGCEWEAGWHTSILHPSGSCKGSWRGEQRPSRTALSVPVKRLLACGPHASFPVLRALP